MRETFSNLQDFFNTEARDAKAFLDEQEHDEPNKEADRVGLQEQFNGLRSHMEKYGPPKVHFHNGKQLPPDQDLIYAEQLKAKKDPERDGSSSDNEDQGEAPLPKFQETLVFQSTHNGLDVLENENYYWLGRVIPIIEGSIKDIKLEIYLIEKKWRDSERTTLDNPKFREQMEDDGKIFELQAAAHDLKKRLTVFKKGYSVLAGKINRRNSNKIVRKINKIEEEFEREWHESDMREDSVVDEITALQRLYTETRNLRNKGLNPSAILEEQRLSEGDTIRQSA